MLDVDDADVNLFELIKVVPLSHQGPGYVGHTAMVVRRSLGCHLCKIGGPMLYAGRSLLASFCGQLLGLCGRLLFLLTCCGCILLVLIGLLTGVVLVPLVLTEV